MVHGHRRDHSEHGRVDDVRCIEATAQPDLEQDDVSGDLGEGEQGCRCCDLEERDRLPGVRLRNARQQIDQAWLRNWPAAAVGSRD